MDEEWWGRLFFLDPSIAGRSAEELRFLQEMVRRWTGRSTTYTCCAACACRPERIKRARFARELHDGAVQSLIAVEMQVDVLRRQSTTKSESVPEELGRIQGLLREEVLKLRELMQQMKSLDVDSRKLIGFLVRYSREISARNRDHSQVLVRSGRAGHAPTCLP